MTAVRTSEVEHADAAWKSLMVLRKTDANTCKSPGWVSRGFVLMGLSVGRDGYPPFVTP